MDRKGPYFPHGKSGGSRFQGFLEGRFDVGYGATRRIWRNLTLICPTLGLGPGQMPHK